LHGLWAPPKPHLTRSRSRTKSTTSVFWTTASNPPQSSGQFTHNSLTCTPVASSRNVEFINHVYLLRIRRLEMNTRNSFCLNIHAFVSNEPNDIYFFSYRPHLFILFTDFFFSLTEYHFFCFCVVVLQHRTASSSGERTNVNISSCTKTRLRSDRSINT